ncbi:hypothetical protein BC937DRAFT_94854 [Endogone sp. FLAS-F59071]|nr:hypothetical protein BC937DRAFT_94854 [Endogone sp. FLAS-F59071]|eukprot:RUS20602.1 hypothetical protein BC937DRAFT_94854 [Endogone sp. FLAS-F59071]
MTDTNWCTYCDKSINPFSNSLYCSDECLKCDALNHHPMLGYNYEELQDFPRSTSSSSSLSSSSTPTSPIPSYAFTSPTFSPYLGTTNANKVSPPNFSLGQPAFRSTTMNGKTKTLNTTTPVMGTKRIFFF